ncbi:hypothetical protein BY996DRAFT_4587778 [Phakopsora pachyrhizi]|nr:hypothetical protein BY996DRAFT_4587778 [Phakopsora pachyrhizi]
MRSDSPIDKNILRGFERLKLFETPRIYSRTGFDLMGALARVERRPNPQISLGPVDTSAAIVIVDAKQQDFPIIFATPSFSSMTGYDLEEILGRNCRFLQYQPNDPRHLKQQRTNVSQKLGSPKSKQKSSLNNRPLEKIKHHIFKGEETQSTLVNYKKDGNAFVNFLTVIPITWNTPEIEYFVGFQVDVVEQTDLIFHQIQSKRYFSHFKSQPTSNSQQKPMPSGSNPYPFATESSPEVNPSGFQKFQEIDSNLNQVSSFYTEHALKRISDPISNLTSLSHKLILGESSDLILAVSLKGRLFYVSHSSEYHLGYTSEELICDNISKICHHTDLTMILRQLKEIGNVADTPIELNFRSIKKDGSLTWMELEGKLHLEPGKGRKYVVVVGRPRQIAQIKWSMIKMLSLKEFWMRLSREALCLYCTGKVEELLSYPVRSIIGRSLIELSQTPEKGLRILEIIHQVQITGEARALKHSLAHRSGRMVPIILTVYPSHPHPLGHMKEFYCQVALDGEDANQSCDPPFSFPGHQSESPSNQPARTTFHPKPLDSNLFSQLETHKTTAWK